MNDQKPVTVIKDPLNHIVFRLGRFSSFTPGGLVRPNAEKYKNMYGRVTQVGSVFHPKEYRGRDVRVGDLVILKNWDEIIALPPSYGKNLYLCEFDHIVGWIIMGEE